jgi:hypothetical protein
MTDFRNGVPNNVKKYQVGLGCKDGNHTWEYTTWQGTAPVADDEDRHVVDIECSICKQPGVEIYSFEGYEEIDEDEDEDE